MSERNLEMNDGRIVEFKVETVEIWLEGELGEKLRRKHLFQGCQKGSMATKVEMGSTIIWNFWEFSLKGERARSRFLCTLDTRDHSNYPSVQGWSVDLGT